MKRILFMGLDKTEVGSAQYVPGQRAVVDVVTQQEIVRDIDEVWTMNDWWRTAPNVYPDRCWNMHAKVGQHATNADRCFCPTKYNDWPDTAVYTLRNQPDIENNRVQDLSQFIDIRRDPIFTSSWGYLWVTAWMEHALSIHMLGVTYRHPNEYRGQLLGFLAGMAESRRKKIRVIALHEDRWNDLAWTGQCDVSYAAVEAGQVLTDVTRMRK